MVEYKYVPDINGREKCTNLNVQKLHVLTYKIRRIVNIMVLQAIIKYENLAKDPEIVWFLY